MRLADWRYSHLKYSVDMQQRLNRATKRCALDCRIGDPWSEAGFTLEGVIEAFAYMREVAPDIYLPYAAAVVWTAPEFLTVCELVGEMQP